MEKSYKNLKKTLDKINHYSLKDISLIETNIKIAKNPIFAGALINFDFENRVLRAWIVYWWGFANTCLGLYFKQRIFCTLFYGKLILRKWKVSMAKYELVAMGFLFDRPMHGYQINQEAKVHRMDSWAKINPPMIYKTLTNLEKDKMVSWKVERQGLMPERKVYRLTPKGKERLTHLVERSLMDKNLTYDLSNLGYFFIFALPKDKALECFKQKKSLLERSVKSLNKRLEDFRGKTPINRFIVIEKDLDRFKSEIFHLKKIIKSVDNCKDWKASEFF